MLIKIYNNNFKYKIKGLHTILFSVGISKGVEPKLQNRLIISNEESSSDFGVPTLWDRRVMLSILYGFRIRKVDEVLRFYLTDVRI